MGSHIAWLTYYFDGGFQTCLYFDESIVFSIPSEVEEDIMSEYGDIIRRGVNCVNVRHGDYCLAPHAFPVCAKKYFQDAMDLLEKMKNIFLSLMI